jgi:hypothetical protein
MAADIGDSALAGAIGPAADSEDVSPLEQELLDEYERLADNMKKVSTRETLFGHC